MSGTTTRRWTIVVTVINVLMVVEAITFLHPFPARRRQHKVGIKIVTHEA